MADSFRISSRDGKIPPLSVKKKYNEVIRHIRSMEPPTAYIVVQGILLPALQQLSDTYLHGLQKPALPSPPDLLTSLTDVSLNDKKIEVTRSEAKGNIFNQLNKVKKELGEIQSSLKDLQKNAKTILEFRKSKNESINSILEKIIKHKGLWEGKGKGKRTGTTENVWIEGYYRREFGGILGKFYTLRDTILHKLKEMDKALNLLKKQIPKSLLITELQEVKDQLIKNIPEANNNDDWVIPSYNIHPSKGGAHRWSTLSEKLKAKKPNYSLQDPRGFIEMVQDETKLNKYLAHIEKGLGSIDKFLSGNKIDMLGFLDTESAYIYLITVVIPFLQNESARALEKQGETMKQVSKTFDKWNEIQDEINGFSKIIETIKKKGLIDESGKLKITNIVDYVSKYDGKNYKVVWIKDDDQSFKPLIDAKKSIDAKINEMKTLLENLEGKLPSSQKSLITTMKELTSQLALKREKEYNFYYHPSGKSELRFEIRDDFVNLPNNKDFEYMRKFIFSTMRNEYFFIADADQTKFKAYMDNIAQGITALTSISNMTQQELQIATQYYNSLLGLQKSAFDSINKVVQIATKSPGH